MNRNLNPKDSEPEERPGIYEAYRLLLGEVSQLREARRALDARLEKAEAAQDLLRQLLNNSENAASTEGSPERKKRFHKGSRTFQVVTRCKKIIKEAARPMDRAELLQALEVSGYKVSSKDPARAIGRTLWESDEFVHIPRAGYWLAEEQLPETKI